MLLALLRMPIVSQTSDLLCAPNQSAPLSLLAPARLKAMYYDRKRDMINRGTWFDDPEK